VSRSEHDITVEVEADNNYRPVSTLALYFTKHRGLATGLTIAGSSLGGVVWPIVDDQLLNRRGLSFGWTMRINGFIAIPLAIIVTVCVRRPNSAPLVKKAKAESAPETAAVAQENKTLEEEEAEKQAKRKAGLAVLKRPVFILFASGAAIFNLGRFTHALSFPREFVTRVIDLEFRHVLALLLRPSIRHTSRLWGVVRVLYAVSHERVVSLRSHTDRDCCRPAWGIQPCDDGWLDRCCGLLLLDNRHKSGGHHGLGNCVWVLQWCNLVAADALCDVDLHEGDVRDGVGCWVRIVLDCVCYSPLCYTHPLIHEDRHR
jgi:hypothetical protein